MKRSILRPSQIALICISLLWASCGPQAQPEWSSLKREIRDRFPSVPQLTTKELHAWLASPDREKPILLDARTSKEYAVSHLAGALLASSERQALTRLDGVDKGRPIVVYCSVGYRSSALAEKLQRSGFTKVYNLEGAIFEWANEGRPVYRGDKEVKVVHPYDEEWGRLLKKELWEKAE